MYKVIHSVRLKRYLKYDVFLYDKVRDAFLFDTLRDIRQNHWTMKYRSQRPAKIYEVTHSMKLNKYPKYDAYLLDRARDIEQNHWTM